MKPNEIIFERKVFHPSNPNYEVAHVEVKPPFWAHIKKDRRPASILCLIRSYGSISIGEAEQLRDALSEAIEKAKGLKLEKPQSDAPPPKESDGSKEGK